MLMSVAEIASGAGVYPELAGSRILITGLSATCGVDITRAFAEHGCRIVLQIPEPCPETDALLQTLSEAALELRVHHDSIDEAAAATRFTQSAAKAYGGLDCVINLIQISRYDLNAATTMEEVDALISARLQAAAHTTKVAANRMGLTWSNGSVLNVLSLPAPSKASEAALAGIARSALATMTRAEAANWAGQGIRINATAPRAIVGPSTDQFDDCMRCEPDIAAVALYLASHNGAHISGHILDSEGVSGAA